MYIVIFHLFSDAVLKNAYRKGGHSTLNFTMEETCYNSCINDSTCAGAKYHKDTKGCWVYTTTDNCDPPITPSTCCNYFLKASNPCNEQLKTLFQFLKTTGKNP